MAPVEETATLYDQVSEGTLAPPPRAEAPPARRHAKLGEPPAELPLVGRDARAGGARRRPRPGTAGWRPGRDRGRGGDRKDAPGARARAERHGTSGAVVLAARCHEDEAGLPYGPIVELLREAVSRIERARLARRPPAPAPGGCLAAPARAGEPAERTCPMPLPLDGPGAQVRLLEGVAAVHRRGVRRTAARASSCSTTSTPRTRPRSTRSPTSVAGCAAGRCCWW